MAIENTIMWEKWYDPYGLDDDTIVDEDIIETAHEFIENEISPLESQGISEATEEMEEINEKKYKGDIKVITTPMGIIPLNDNTASNKIFNFWTGHTNFNITAHVLKIIEETEGVETLDIFTRYRFRIAVGKAFEDSEVMRLINQQVYKELLNV